jgi:hypothetical protein
VAAAQRAAEGHVAAQLDGDAVDDADAPVDVAAARKERTARFKSNIYANTACPLCNAPVGGPIHMATTCTRAEIVERRGKTTLATLGSEMLDLGDALALAYHKAKPAPALRALAAAIKVDDGAEGTFMTAHYVTATPWPAIAARDDWPVAKTLGTLFDANPKGASLAAFSNKWMTGGQ